MTKLLGRSGSLRAINVQVTLEVLLSHFRLPVSVGQSEVGVKCSQVFFEHIAA